jgi:hypothetical protein
LGEQVILMFIEWINDRRGELPGRDFLGEKDVELVVRSIPGLW